MPVILKNVCFVHDIGNAPFGHFGETIVSDYFQKLKNTGHSQFCSLTDRQQRDFLNYDGNAQGLRVLTKLQFLNNPFGLNLTYATLASYLKYPNCDPINKDVEQQLKLDGQLLVDKCIEKSKHGVFYSEESYFDLIIQECGLSDGKRNLRHPLCYLMEAADSIAYVCMDMEDGFNIGLFDIEYIKKVFTNSTSEVALSVVNICDNQYYDNNTKIVNIRIRLIEYFVDLAYNNFEDKLDEIETGSYNKELVKDDQDKIYKLVEKFSNEKIFTSREINYLETTGYSVFKGLLDFYIEFLFSDNNKYVQRAKSLISKSIVNSAIDENLIQLCEEKLVKKIAALENQIVAFKNEPDYVDTLKEDLAAAKSDKNFFDELSNVYTPLFEKQFSSLLASSDEHGKLNESRQKIYDLVKPQFEDLSVYYKFRVILDFISGMTDQYALNHYQKISGQKIN